jgi:hypothetical protein
MKTRLLKVVLVAIVLGVFAGNVWAEKAAEPNQPKEPAENLLVVKGIVSMTNDREGKITAVKITAGKEKIVYEVVLNAKGTELGEKMDGKIVRVTGTVETKDTAKWITVKTYSEVQKPSAKKSVKPTVKK